MKIDNFDMWECSDMWECGVTQDFEVAWVHLKSVHFHEYCNAYKLLLKTICHKQSFNSAMNLYIYNANFDV